jgi:hypothetical protein
MPRNETIIGTFVASPSDVEEERASLESVIAELNKTWSKNLNLRLDLMKWETDVHPGFGQYPQDVINTQISDEYDIFIAIFWGKIGSPTKEYESGTLEEFDRAYKKYLENRKSVDILIYFKDQPIAPSKMDFEQLAKLNEVKCMLGEKGGLYWTFDNTKDFESLLRGHLSKVAQEWSSRIGYAQKAENETDDDAKPTEINELGDKIDDYGLLDYIEVYEDRMYDMTSSLSSIVEATEKVGQQFNRRTAEIESLKNANGDVDKSRARKIIKFSCDDMERYSEILEAQIKIMSKSREDAFEALSKALAMHVDFRKEGDENDLQELEDSLMMMTDSAREGISGLKGFKDSISVLPKLTIQLNRSKRRAVRILDTLLEEVYTTIQTASDVLKTIEGLREVKKI